MLYFSEEELVKRMWSGAVAKQVLITKGIKTIHHCCFPHLQTELEELTDNYVKFHLDLEKHKDLAPDRSHAGANSHQKLCDLIMLALGEGFEPPRP